jgi:hypothetical protein
MRARWCEPKSGRFLSEDPKGLGGGINPYQYAAADPINGSDPSGLDGFNPCPSGYELVTTTRQIGEGQEETTEDCVRVETHTHSVAWGDQTAAALWAGASGKLSWLSANQNVCWGRTDDPHMSTHNPGAVNVVGKTWCHGMPMHMSVETELQRKQCTALMLCSWTRISSGYYERLAARRVQANAAASCIPGWYRGLSSHVVFMTWGQNRIATVTDQFYFSCS